MTSRDDDQKKILDALRAAREEVPAPPAPTPEEIAEAKALAERNVKRLLGVRGVSQDLLKLPDAVSIEPLPAPEPIGPIKVEVVGKADKKDGGPAPLPTEIVEQAVLAHVEKELGRRKLAIEIPGLTEYQAGQVLGWFRAGRPAGLWLENGRLKWGKAISTTPAGLRLPRL